MARRTLRTCRLRPDALLPQRAHAGDAGFDVFSREAVTLQPGSRYAVGTGIAVEIPFGMEGQLRSRSGLAKDWGVVVLNSPATIDSGYRGEIFVLLTRSWGPPPWRYFRGMRIAQLIVSSVIQLEIEDVPALPDTARETKGFGSSGGYPKKDGSGL